MVVFSLTGRGRALAKRIGSAFPEAEISHRPDDFAATARRAFSEGRRCVFICAAGIVVRSLAPVLADKHTDPAVLVLDEHGRFVVPLLSGHEGGGCTLGRRVAEVLGAQLVVTSASDYSRPVHCVGVGTDRGCPGSLLEALYAVALTEFEDVPGVDLVASIVLKRDEPAVHEFAASHDAEVGFYTAAELRGVEDRLSERSAIVFRETGCYGVAEAAALLGAQSLTGNPAELVVTKRKNARATLAVARSYP